MVKKTKITLEEEIVPEIILSDTYNLSGADMEAILTRAKFEAVAHEKTTVDLHLLEQVISNIIPPTYPEEVELQTLLAVLECTSKLLPIGIFADGSARITRTNRGITLSNSLITRGVLDGVTLLIELSMSTLNIPVKLNEA